MIVCSPLPPVKLGSALHNNEFFSADRDNNDSLLESSNLLNLMLEGRTCKAEYVLSREQ